MTPPRVHRSTSSTSTPSRQASAEDSYPRFQLHVGLGVGYTGIDMDNGDGHGHTGVTYRGEAGVTALFSDSFFGQGSVGGTFGSASQDLGAGVTSERDHWGLSLLWRNGLRLFDDWVRPSLGAEFGLRSVSSDGAEYTRNPLLVPFSSTAASFSLEAGVGIFSGALSVLFRYGWELGLNPNPELLDAERQIPTGLNPSFWELSFLIDPLAFAYRMGWLGRGSSSERSRHEEEGSRARPAPASSEGGSSAAPTRRTVASGETPAPAPEAPLAGLELIEDLRQQIAQKVEAITQAAAQVTSARDTYRSISGESSESNGRRLVQVRDAVIQARRALESYHELDDLVTRAQRESLALRGAQGRRASAAIRHLVQQQVTAYRAASQAFQQVSSLITAFMEIRRHPEFSDPHLQAPIPPAGMRPARPQPRPHAPRQQRPPRQQRQSRPADSRRAPAPATGTAAQPPAASAQDPADDGDGETTDD